MNRYDRRGCCGPGCLLTLLALALWLPQMIRGVALLAVGRTPTAGPLVVTTVLLVGVLVGRSGWQRWHAGRTGKGGDV